MESDSSRPSTSVCDALRTHGPPPLRSCRFEALATTDDEGCPSFVHSANCTSPTSSGRTKWASVVSAWLSGVENGVVFRASGASNVEQLLACGRGETGTDLADVGESVVGRNAEQQRAEAARALAVALRPPADDDLLGVEVLHLHPVPLRSPGE